MWYGQTSPWMQSRQTPGAGMPPYGQNMPMPMQRPQIPTPHVAPSNLPLQSVQQGQGGSVSPQLMGMLSGLLASRRETTGQKTGAPENTFNPALPPQQVTPLPPDMAQRNGGAENAPGAASGIEGWLARLLGGRP
ncbi:MAG TPA: hypothetical protein VJR58_34305 [Vineibacter sp.]|nr:hypothetical protein [Vineibacter sp.]